MNYSKIAYSVALGVTLGILICDVRFVSISFIVHRLLLLTEMWLGVCAVGEWLKSCITSSPLLLLDVCLAFLVLFFFLSCDQLLTVNLLHERSMVVLSVVASRYVLHDSFDLSRIFAAHVFFLSLFYYFENHNFCVCGSVVYLWFGCSFCIRDRLLSSTPIDCKMSSFRLTFSFFNTRLNFIIIAWWHELLCWHSLRSRILRSHWQVRFTFFGSFRFLFIYLWMCCAFSSVCANDGGQSGGSGSDERKQCERNARRSSCIRGSIEKLEQHKQRCHVSRRLCATRRIDFASTCSSRCRSVLLRIRPSLLTWLRYVFLSFEFDLILILVFF